LVVLFVIWIEYADFSVVGFISCGSFRIRYHARRTEGFFLSLFHYDPLFISSNPPYPPFQFFSSLSPFLSTSYNKLRTAAALYFQLLPSFSTKALFSFFVGPFSISFYDLSVLSGYRGIFFALLPLPFYRKFFDI